jgi:cytochrome P450
MTAPRTPPSTAGPERPIPGLRGWELARALGPLSKRPHEFLLELSIRFGGIFDLPYPLERVIVLSDPEYIEYVLHRNYRNYLKDTGRYHSFQQILGNGLLTSDGQTWLRQRQRVQPAFHANRMAVVEQAIEEETAPLLERWRHHAQTGEPVPVLHEMLALMLRILTRAMFSRDCGDVLDPVLAAFKSAHAFLNPFSAVNLMDPPAYLRPWITPGYGAFARSLRTLDDVVNRIIRERVESGVDLGDMLSMMVSGRDEDASEAMTSTQMRD